MTRIRLRATQAGSLNSPSHPARGEKSRLFRMFHRLCTRLALYRSLNRGALQSGLLGKGGGNDMFIFSQAKKGERW